MRSIPSILANRVRMLAQVPELNSAPKNRMIITRNTVPITDFDMWQTATINAGSPTKTSIAVSRPSANAGPLVAYVAAIESGELRLYSATLKGLLPPTVWSLELSVADAVDVAIAFDGHYVKQDDGMVEFLTGDLWIFYINTLAEVWGGRFGHLGDTKLATNAAALSAIMGPGNVGPLTISDGIVLAWVTTGGAVMTRQYFGEVWEDAVLHSSMPANAMDIALTRTWDYRLSVNLQTTDEKVWLINGNSQVSGNANISYIDMAAMDLTTDVYATVPHDTKIGDENLQVADMDLITGAYSITAPTLISVENIDDGTGNWGLKLRLVYSGPVYDLAGNAAAYVLQASANFGCAALDYDPADPDKKTLILYMADFNNGAPNATLQYTQGTLDSGPGVTLLPNHNMAVTLVNLAPSMPPAVQSIVSINNTTIDVQFDAPISSANIGANAAALAITGNEPAYSPGGALVPTTYVISSVAMKPASSDTVRITLTYAGRLKHPQANVNVAYNAALGNLKNAGGSLSISAFNVAFDPDEAALVLFVNPHDPENMQVGDITMTCDVGTINFVNAKSGDENMQASNITITVAVYDTLNNPV
jgi:hypothetical protein